MNANLDSVIEKQFNARSGRISILLNRYERRFQQQFLKMIQGIKSDIVLRDIEALLGQGRFLEALSVVQSHIEGYAAQISQAYRETAENTAAFISTRVLVTFDITNFRAVQTMRANQLALIREFTQEQVLATRTALTHGISLGLNPKQQARMFRDSIGLTQNQQAAVNNYENLLRSGSRQALDRKLRDRRFDSTFDRSIRTGKPLSEDQIQRMVGRYREKYIDLRSKTIARTESLSSVHEGNHEMFKQATDSGKLSANEVERTWYPFLDGVTRDSHADMNQQVRGLDEPFTSGNGVSLMYPGDRSAPGEERINCRCSVGTRLKDAG